MASGTLADLVDGAAQGLGDRRSTGLPQPPAASQPGVRGVTAIAAGRYAVDALPTEDPLAASRAISPRAAAASSRSTQVHDTLEDLFVRQVDQASGTDRFATRRRRRREAAR